MYLELLTCTVLSGSSGCDASPLRWLHLILIKVKRKPWKLDTLEQSWQIVICCLLVKRRSTVISPIAVDELHRDVFLWKENVSLAKILN